MLFGIDVETDVGSFTPYYGGVRHGLPLMLELFRSKGIAATFFFTGDAARQHPRAARAVAREHEVGCHSLHHETLGDELFPLPNVKPLLPEEVELRIRRATAWVEEAAGVRPVSFRCPRLWGSTRVINVLQAVMESADSPLERDRDQWPLFRTGDGSGIYRCVDNFLRFVGERRLRPVLCFYFHPWEFVPVAERFDFGEATVIPHRFLTENCGGEALALLGRLIDRLLGRGCRFVRADELARSWES